ERTLADSKTAMTKDPRGYRMLGDYYIGVGDSEKALAEFASLSQAHPKDLGVRRAYIQLLLSQNHAEEASAVNERILKENPKDPEAMIVRGQLLARDGHWNEALSALQNAVKNVPNNAVGHFYLGVAYSQTGASDQAESEWHTAVRLAPSLVDAQRALASLALSRSDWNSLADIANQLILAQPRAPLGYVYRGAERVARGDQATAEMNFGKAMELAPGDSAGYIQMAKLRLLQKRPGEAEKLYQQALVRDPNSIDALNGIVFMEMQQKQPSK